MTSYRAVPKFMCAEYLKKEKGMPENNGGSVIWNEIEWRGILDGLSETIIWEQ